MNATLMLGLALMVGAPIKEEKKKDEPSIVGEWILESMSMLGMPVPQAQKKGDTKFSFTKDGEMIVNENGRDEKGTYIVDTKKKVFELDLIPPANQKEPTISAIFKFDGDKVIIYAHFDLNNKTPGKRPSDFTSTADNSNMLITLKRVKKD